MKRLLQTTVVSYASIVFLLWVLQWILGENIVGMGIVKTVIQLLLFPALVLLPLMLMMQRAWLALALVPCVLAFLVSYGQLLVPRARDAVEVPTLRLMTFNLQSPGEDEVASLVEIIDTAAADVVALQELTPPAAEAFAAELGEKYPYRALNPDAEFSGQGVLSRYPIQEDEYWQYEALPGAIAHQRVVLQFNEQTRIVLYNVHPVPPVTYEQYLNAKAHRRSVSRLLDEIRTERDPVLLAGDFNMTDSFHGYRQIVERFSDAFRKVGEIGFGFTFPHKADVPLPALLRLDYIFYDAAFVGIDAHVWPETGTADHAPVVADLVPAN